MVEQEQLNKLVSYVRGLITGDREDYDFVDVHELNALRRRSLADVLLEYQVANKRIRPAHGNLPSDLLHVVELVRRKLGMSKKEVADRSGISRGHVSKLLSESGMLSTNPTLETLVRLAIAIDWPLEVAELRVEVPVTAPRREPKGVPWKKVGIYGASTVFGVGVIASLVNYLKSRNGNGSKGST